jgi:Spy/CpxP family protein refolding chaperone
MRPRDRILANLEATYREQYDRARTEQQAARMAELDAGYQRDQLMLEILLDIRDLLTTARALPPASSIPGSKSDG